MIMKNVEAHRGQSPFRVLTRPLYGLALRRVVSMAQENLVAGRLTLILPNGETLVADSQRPGPDATVK